MFAGVTVPLAAVQSGLSLAYGVGAHPGGDPAADLPFRGTALAPPLFLPVLLTAGAALARRPGRSGAVGTGVAGLVGLAFVGGATLNLPNDIEAARAAGSPVPLTIALGVVYAGLGLGLAGNAAAALASRRAASRGSRLSRYRHA